MGNFLDKPITEKETLGGQGNGMVFGCSAMQGWRVEMEDAHTTEVSITKKPDCAFFAVYDGHGGSTVSYLAAKRLLPTILDTEALSGNDFSADNLVKGFRDGMYTTDKDLRTLPKLKSLEDKSGSTMIGCFITPTHFVVGNCGDSRFVLISDDRPKFGTVDHKPSDQLETDRVRAAGGFVEIGRVCGNLAVSRALGDYMYKDMPSLSPAAQKISVDPDITVLERDDKDQFAVLACDGIWDVMTNETITHFVLNHARAGFTVEETCERLLDHCLEKNSKDNMSVIIVKLPGAPSKQEGYELAPSPADDHPAENQVQQPPAIDAAFLRAMMGVGKRQQEDKR